MASRVRGLSFHRLYRQLDVWPDGCAGPGSLGETPHDDADPDLAHDHGPADLACGWRAMNEGPALARAVAAPRTYLSQRRTIAMKSLLLALAALSIHASAYAQQQVRKADWVEGMKTVVPTMFCAPTQYFR